MDHSEYVFQESCFETKIHREVSEDLQDGVKAIIGIAITIVILVLIYNVVYQVQNLVKFVFFKIHFTFILCCRFKEVGEAGLKRRKSK